LHPRGQQPEGEGGDQHATDPNPGGQGLKLAMRPMHEDDLWKDRRDVATF
jgi:hypothetical protein